MRLNDGDEPIVAITETDDDSLSCSGTLEEIYEIYGSCPEIITLAEDTIQAGESITRTLIVDGESRNFCCKIFN